MEEMTITVKNEATGNTETFDYMDTNPYFTYGTNMITFKPVTEKLEFTINCIGLKSSIDGELHIEPNTTITLKMKP